jgi:hypothetical protein
MYCVAEGIALLLDLGVPWPPLLKSIMEMWVSFRTLLEKIAFFVADFAAMYVMVPTGVHS